jgi:hypothetical protein
MRKKTMNIKRETTKLIPPITLDEVRDEIETRLNQFLVKTVLYDRPVLVVPGTPPTTLLYIDVTPFEEFRVSLAHNGPDRFYGNTRTFKTAAAMCLWIKRQTTREWSMLKEWQANQAVSKAV